MKKLLFILLILCNTLVAQNLVPNPSFEDTIPLAQNPFYTSVESATGWFSKLLEDQSPDYLSATYYYNFIGSNVPVNSIGYQNALTGVAYMGFGTYWIGQNDFTELFTTKLSNPLVSNHTYFVNFNVSLADSSQYAMDRIGAYLSVDTPKFNNGLIYTPQIENPANAVLADTANWVPISGYYIATGGEQLITLGNFRYATALNIDTLAWGNLNGAYYFIDDVSVIDCTAAGINENDISQLLQLNPNPTATVFQIVAPNTITIKEVTVLTENGAIAKHFKKPLNSYDVASLPKGIYLVKIKTNRGVGYKKLVLQ